GAIRRKHRRDGTGGDSRKIGSIRAGNGDGIYAQALVPGVRQSRQLRAAGLPDVHTPEVFRSRKKTRDRPTKRLNRRAGYRQHSSRASSVGERRAWNFGEGPRLRIDQEAVNSIGL